jgi:hypothetical protein
MVQERSIEQRLRRMADRQGLALQRSRRRDPHALGFGTYQLVNERGRVVAGDRQRGYGLTLDQVEAFLTGEEADRG